MSQLEATRLHASRASSSALLHGLGSLAVGVGMLAEDPAGYSFAVFDGPRALVAFLPGRPIAAWGAAFLVLGAATLALRGSGARWVLVGVAGAWGTFGASALLLGVTSTQAATVGGLAFLIIGADAARAALEYRRFATTLPMTPALRDALWDSHMPPQKGLPAQDG